MITTYKIKNESGADITWGTQTITDGETKLITMTDIVNYHITISDVPQYNTIYDLIIANTVKILKNDIELAVGLAAEWLKHFYDSEGRTVADEYSIEHPVDTADAHMIPAITGLESALSSKTSSIDFANHLGDTNPHNIDKSTVGLSNVDNTSDVSKPISALTQAALDNKENTLGLGNAGQVLATNAAATGKEWVDVASTGGQVNSVVAGTHIAVDSSDAANPIVSSTLTVGDGELSENNFTTALKTKLENLETSKFRGQFSAEEELVGISNPMPGDYAYVNDETVDIQSFIWDDDDGKWVSATPGVITDHGSLTGLTDDDHTQYLNNTRGDARYYQKAEVDTALGNKQNTLTAGTNIVISGDTISTNAEANVQSDWSQTNTAADDFIKNKPTIPAPQTFLHADLTDKATDGHPASIITYDNSSSSLTATKVQSAIDELKTDVDTNSSSITNVAGDLNTHTGNTSNPHSVTKTQVGLGNVDNTSDVNKPISSATQTALNNKEAALGVPTSNGQVLASQTNGTRSWVDLPTGGSNTTSVEFARPFNGAYIGNDALKISRAGTTVSASTGDIPMVYYIPAYDKQILSFNYSIAIYDGNYASTLTKDVSINIVVNDSVAHTEVIPTGHLAAGEITLTTPIDLNAGDGLYFEIFSNGEMTSNGVAIDATLGDK